MNLSSSYTISFHYTHRLLTFFLMLLWVCCFASSSGQALKLTQFDKSDTYFYYVERLQLTGEYDNYRVLYFFNDNQGFFSVPIHHITYMILLRPG